jgi:hypothetical protein
LRGRLGGFLGLLGVVRWRVRGRGGGREWEEIGGHGREYGEYGVRDTLLVHAFFDGVVVV